ncbi:hypothetical protein INT45_001693 [Circinella minor]|uniref:Uncharacterized protein n=1 Tax=Circinella minor TaxID=1195481 RepID=A0A8H7VHY9_9FUNG|nr:hypothetical protein INT45_001693 [Circinella minor]
MDQINLLTFIAIMAEFVPILGITLTLLIERAKHLAEHHHHIDDAKIIIDQLKGELEKDLKNTKVDKNIKDQSRSRIMGRVRAFVLEWFVKNDRIGYHIEKAIACNETAPETGEKHVHIWIQMNERFDTKSARKFFTIDGVPPNMKPGGNPQKAISYFISMIHTEMENNPGSKLYMCFIFGIETMFSGKNKIPQYWIVGPSNVGKTYNIDMIEQGGHRAYLMNKENDWSDYKDDDYDFMYNEEMGSDFKLTFLNQM